MPLNSGFYFFFAISVFFALAASLNWYLVAWRLSTLGFPIKLFATLRDTISMFREYAHAAPTKGWSKWPLAVFWLTSVGMLLAGIAAVLSASPETATAITNRFPTLLTLLPWATIASLCFAFIFSYRVRKKREKAPTDLSLWTQLRTDDFFRNDLYVSALAWLGFLVTLTLIVVSHLRR